MSEECRMSSHVFAEGGGSKPKAIGRSTMGFGSAAREFAQVSFSMPVAWRLLWGSRDSIALRRKVRERLQVLASEGQLPKRVSRRVARIGC